MTEQATTNKETEPTSLELANSWLSFREAKTQKELDETEQYRKWTENYEMKAPGARPSDIEPGGTDASDWDLVEGEFNQWPEEKEERLNDYDSKIQTLQNELYTIEDYKDRIEEGDTGLIAELSEKEKERREEVEKQKQKIEKTERVLAEKKAGKDMDGVLETEAVLRKLIDLGKSEKVPEREQGKNGWELERRWDDKHLYDKNNSQIEFTLAFSEGKWIRVDISTYPGPILPYEKRETGRVDVGESIGFTLKEGKIHDWGKGKVERSFQYGYPDRHWSSSDEEFDQSDFNSARNIISELYSDLENIPLE